MQQPDDSWYIDRGSTSHLMNNQGKLSNFVNWKTLYSRIMVGDGPSIPGRGIGTTTLPPPFPSLTLKNILYTPKIIRNLIFIHKFTSDNMFLLFTSSFAVISPFIWHNRLGHPQENIFSFLR